MRFVVCFLAILSLSLGSLAGLANAYSGGIFDKARTVGCNCHGGLLPPNTTTQLVIDGLPTEAGYIPGETYELELYVLGFAIPLGPSLLTQLAGFNLDASHGRLEREADDQRVETVWETECQVRQRALQCNATTTCGVRGEEICRTVDDCHARRCSNPGTDDCRLCSDMIARIQATHTSTGGTTPIEAWTDGNSIPSWKLLWTAPDPGVGDVTFHMAGNAVNGNTADDEGDNWSMFDPPLVLPQAP